MCAGDVLEKEELEVRRMDAVVRLPVTYICTTHADEVRGEEGGGRVQLEVGAPTPREREPRARSV